MGKLQVAMSSLFLAAVGFAGAHAHATESAPVVWLSAVSDLPAPAGFQVDQDYLQLFEPGAPWNRAVSHVQVFQMTRRDVMSHPDETLQKMFTFLHEHHVALAVTFGMIPDKNCGARVEGMVHHPDENLRTAERVKKLGGNLQYINVDEPLFFGHYFVGRDDKIGCRYSLEDLSSGYADEVRKVRSVLPNAQIIEDEPTEGLESAADLGRWIDLVKHELGEGAPRAIRFDVQWSSRKRPWRQAVHTLVEVARQHGMRYGVIFDGTPEDQTDAAWVHTAEANIKAWEEAIHDIPEHVMIQSWHRHPQRLLPETSPTTLPYLVNWYCDNARMAQGCRRE